MFQNLRSSQDLITNWVEKIKPWYSSKFHASHLYCSPTELLEGNVFSYVCVCHSLCPQGGEGWVPCDHYPWCIVPHYSPPLPKHQTWDPLPQTPTTSSDIWWLPLETCSILFTWGPTPPNWCWYLVAVEGVTVSSGGQYASYWNSFLFFFWNLVISSFQVIEKKAFQLKASCPLSSRGGHVWWGPYLSKGSGF